MAAHQGRRTISTLNLCGGAAKRALYVDPSGLFSEKCFWAYNALMFILPSSSAKHCRVWFNKDSSSTLYLPRHGRGEILYFSQTLSSGLL